MTETKAYVVPLRRGFQKAPFKSKSKKAVKTLKEFIAKHAKVEFENVLIGEELNEKIWERGITNPPAKVQVEVSKDTKKVKNTDVTQAFVNLVGFGRKVEAKATKKGILSKDKAGLKEKLADAVDTIKGKSDSKDEVIDVKAEAKPKAKAKDVKETKKVEETKEVPKTEEKVEAKVEEKAAEKKTE